MRPLIVIPARGGSKGIPRKNLCEVGGVPLIVRAIRAGLPVGDVVVSTDDEQIARVARDAGAYVLQRPAELATDTASSEAVVAHALQPPRDAPYARVAVLLQCSSPFTTSEDIATCVALVETGGYASAFTVADDHRFQWYVNAVRRPEPVGHALPRQRRQDLAGNVVETGGVYAFRSGAFRDHGSRFIEPIGCHRIKSTWRAIEIDEPHDLVVANALAKEYGA